MHNAMYEAVFSQITDFLVMIIWKWEIIIPLIILIIWRLKKPWLYKINRRNNTEPDNI